MVQRTRFDRLAVCGLAALLVTVGKAEATPQTLYGLVRTPGFNELITYDLTQNPFVTGEYVPSSIAPLSFTNILPQNSITSVAVQGTTLYGLITTTGFNELITYDLTQNPFMTGQYVPGSIAPLSFTNILPQNSIADIAVQGTTLYGLIRTAGFDELITYDLTQNPFMTGQYVPSSIAPLSFTNILPQNSITSIAVQGTTLYGLIRTAGFDELVTYDLTQNPFMTGEYVPSSIAPLSFTNILPQNSITSIAVQGTTLYGLITTSGFNELITYDLTQNPFMTGEYVPGSIAPLSFTNILPQNSIADIALNAPSGSGTGADGGGGASPISEPGSSVGWVMCAMTVIFGLRLRPRVA